MQDTYSGNWRLSPKHHSPKSRKILHRKMISISIT